MHYRNSLIAAVAVLALSMSFAARASAGERSQELDALIARIAAANNVPVSLVHRVILRESGYNARLVGRGHTMGLMQIKPATARALGYRGSAAGLLDPETNLTYAVRYLAGAWRVAKGSESRAIRYYASGYYYAAKRRTRAMESVASAD